MDATPEERAMESRTDQLTPAPPEVAGRTRGTSPIRGLMNWFGAVFGAVVLLGGLIVVVADRPAPEPVGDTTVAVQPSADVDEVPDPEAAVTGAADDHVADEPHGDEVEAVEEPSAPAVGTAVDGVIEVEMVEFGYQPAAIEIQAGVPVTLRFTNAGKLTHEAMVGDAHMQEEFASAGNHDDGGGDHHGDLMAVTVEPGQSADLEVLVDEPGTWYFACHLLGHYERGQVATINVTS
jgi:uncharacterized cupredoxin-like copper-binding protein